MPAACERALGGSRRDLSLAALTGRGRFPYHQNAPRLGIRAGLATVVGDAVSETESTASPPLAVRRHFVLQRLFSLSGVLPIGVFLVWHISGYAAAASAARGLSSVPAAFGTSLGSVFLEVVFIGLPMLYHAVYGLLLVRRGSTNVQTYPLGSNWRFALQRWTGVVAFAFILYHVSVFRVPVVLGRLREAELPARLVAELSRTSELGIPTAALVAFVGLSACVLHLTQGLITFCASWGITRSRQSSRILGAMFRVFGAILFLVGTNTLVRLSTGASIWAGVSGVIGSISGAGEVE